MRQKYNEIQQIHPGLSFQNLLFDQSRSSVYDVRWKKMSLQTVVANAQCCDSALQFRHLLCPVSCCKNLYWSQKLSVLWLSWAPLVVVLITANSPNFFIFLSAVTMIHPKELKINASEFITIHLYFNVGTYRGAHFQVDCCACIWFYQFKHCLTLLEWILCTCFLFFCFIMRQWPIDVFDERKYV